MPSTTTSSPDHDWICPRCNPSGTRPDSGIFGSFLSISLDNNSQDSSPVVRDPTSPQDKAAINTSCPYSNCPFRPVDKGSELQLLHPVRRAPRAKIQSRTKPDTPPLPLTNLPPNPFLQKPIVNVHFKDPNHPHANHKIDVIYRDGNQYHLDIRDRAHPSIRHDLVVACDQIVIEDRWEIMRIAAWEWWNWFGTVFCLWRTQWHGKDKPGWWCDSFFSFLPLSSPFFTPFYSLYFAQPWLDCFSPYLFFPCIFSFLLALSLCFPLLFFSTLALLFPLSHITTQRHPFDDSCTPWICI